MKIFNTIQELWEYCLFCPICQKHCRHIQLSMGPDKNLSCFQFWKMGEKLTISTTQGIVFYINCVNNSFSMMNQKCIDTQEAYFYIQSKCLKCKNTFTYSDDLEFVFSNKTISNIGLEREILNILNFEVDLEYSENITYLKAKKSEDIQLPIIKLDYSDPEKLKNKIKTISIFS